MYDRTILINAARSAGIENPNQLAAKLGITRNSAWRLWHGRTTPRSPIAAAVYAELGVRPADLLVPAATDAA